MVGAKDFSATWGMPDGPEGKVAFDVHHPADRRQVLRQHSSRWFIEQLVAGADAKTLCAGLIQDLLRVFDGLGERLLYINVASGLERHTRDRSMGCRRSNDMDDVKLFRSEEFFRRLKTADARHDVAHSGLSRIGGIGHRYQLHTGTSQDGAGVVLRMAAGADKRDPQGT